MDEKTLRKEAIFLTTLTTAIVLYKMSRFWESDSKFDKVGLVVSLLANLLAWGYIFSNQKH